MLAAGVTRLAHLQVALLQQHPPTFTTSLQSVLTTIPPPWRAIVTAAPTAPTWQQGLSASGSQLIQNTQTGQLMDSERFASLIQGIFCGGLNAYCMHIRPLFLRTSGSSGVLKALLLERNGQLSCNPKKKKKSKSKQCLGALLLQPHVRTNCKLNKSAHA